MTLTAVVIAALTMTDQCTLMISSSIEIFCKECGSVLDSKLHVIRPGTNDPGIAVPRCSKCEDILLGDNWERAESEIYEDFVHFFTLLHDELPQGSKIAKFVQLLLNNAQDRDTPSMYDCRFLIVKE